MKSILVSSVEGYSGKSAVIIALGLIEFYNRISADKDIVLVEGAEEYNVGRALGLCDCDVSSALNLEVLMVVKYTDDFVLDRLLMAKELLGDRLKFVLFNQLAGYKKVYVKGIAERFLERKGMELLGTLPYDPLLAGLFVSEIRDALGGEWLVKPAEDEIIEEFLIGAMSPPSALKYFRRVRQAALITGGDRADLQNLALETGNIKCILLTGHLEPPQTMLGKAEEKGVPVILVADDTLATMEKIDEIFGKARIRGDAKIRRIKELIGRVVDLERLWGK